MRNVACWSCAVCLAWSQETPGAGFASEPQFLSRIRKSSRLGTHPEAVHPREVKKKPDVEIGLPDSAPIADTPLERYRNSSDPAHTELN